MTIVEDRPTVDSSAPESQPPTERHASPFATWRFAARLARREVRRRPGRTLLVMLLVAVPVIAMSGASIFARSTSETARENFARLYGTADAVVYPNFETGLPTYETSTLPELPDGTATTTYIAAYTTVWSGDADDAGSEVVALSDIDLTNPITADVMTLISGRVPAVRGETLLAPDVADAFGVEVGDRLSLLRPDVELVVVGIGQRSSWSDEPLMIVAGFDRDLLEPGRAGIETLVDLPDELGSDERVRALDDLDRAGFHIQSPDGFYGNGSVVGARELAWGWVAGVLAFVAVGIVIAAAFATSARRQLVTIGQLASNGASPKLISRTMGLQGMWTGLLGAAVGVPVAIAAFIGVHRADLVSQLAGRPIGDLHVAPLDLAVIAVTAVIAATLAALVPARSAARIPVLSALAGRRPVAQPPRWIAPVGAAMLAGGLLLLAASASVENAGDLVAMIAILGALGVVFGMVCASPLIVAAVARVGGRRSGVTRLASRSLGRARARSSAVLTAIAVVGTIAVVASVVARNVEATDGRFREDPRVVNVNFVADFRGEAVNTEPVDGVVDDPPTFADPLPELVRREIEAVLPDATWTPIERVVHDPLPYDVDTGQTIGEPRSGTDVQQYFGPVVANDDVLAVAELSRAQLAELDATGVLVISAFFADDLSIATLDEPVLVDVSGSNDLIDRAVPSGFSSDGQPLYDEAASQAVYDENRTAVSISEVFVTPQFVTENELETTLSSYRVENPTDLTRNEYGELTSVQSFFNDDAFVESASADGFEFGGTGSDGGWYASAPYPEIRVPWELVQLAVAVASLVLVLAVVAIGLSLAAAESRDERDVLLAVGASPSTLRRVAATKAWVLTLGAALVAVPVGYVTIWVITRAIGHNDVTAPFPFAIAGALIVVIPIIAWLVTLGTSTIAQLLRPVTATSITAD